MKDILLISHYTETPGVADKLALYFERHNYSVFFILNPLYPRSSLKSIIRSEKEEIRYKLFWPLQYVFEGIISFIEYKSNIGGPVNFDIAICFDPLSFVHTFLLKRFFKIKKLVYYNVDFSTRRFRNKIANNIYLLINRFAYKKCDYFFYLTKKFIQKIDPANKYTRKSFLLKHTINMSNINRVIQKIPNSIIYSGSLSYSVDFTNLIKSLELIKKDNINFTFDIYGEGNQKEYLKNLIANSVIKDNVKFKSVIDNETLLKEILPQYMIGVCPYITKENNLDLDHMFHGTDLTTKIVEYIGCGLPVVTTRLYDAFDIIEKNRFGFLVKNEKEWYDAIYKLLISNKLHGEYSMNALNYAKNYDEEKVLTPVFNKILQD